MTALSLENVTSPLSNRPVIRTLAICTLLILVTVGLYAPTRNFDFVNWDDTWYVLNNPLIQSWSFENLKGIATKTVIRNYAPLTIFSFLIDYSLWGEWAGGYHLVNVFLHAVNVVLVYCLLKLVTRRTSIALASAVLFAVHPVHVESVAWVSSRKGLISGAFMLAALLCWLRPERSAKQEVWGIAFLGLALLAKANAVVLPAIVLTYDVIVLRRRFTDAFVRQVIPGILAVWCLLANMSAQMTVLGGVRGHFELSKFEILAVDGIILWTYIGMLIWPKDLCVLYNPSTTGIWLVAILALSAWAGTFWWIWKGRSAQPLVFFAFATWMLLLFPVLNFFPITTLMNDRYLYLPSIPLLALLVGGIIKLSERVRVEKVRYVAYVAAGCGLVLVTAAYMQRTREYLPVWKNDLALWDHAVAQVPELSVVQIQRAISLHNAGKTDAALEALNDALVHCNPDKLDRDRILAKIADWKKLE